MHLLSTFKQHLVQFKNNHSQHILTNVLHQIPFQLEPLLIEILLMNLTIRRGVSNSIHFARTKAK